MSVLKRYTFISVLHLKKFCRLFINEIQKFYLEDTCMYRVTTLSRSLLVLC